MFGKALILGGSVDRPGLGGYAVLFLFSDFSTPYKTKQIEYASCLLNLFSFFSHCLSSHVQRSQLPNWDSRNLNLPHHFPFSHSPSLSFRSPTSFIRLALPLHRLRLSSFFTLGHRSTLFCQRSIRYIISRLSPVPRLLLSLLRVPRRPASVS